MRTATNLLLSTILLILVVACTKETGPSPLKASEVAREFTASKRDALAKYGGREITIRGYTYGSGQLSPKTDAAPMDSGMLNLGDEEYKDFNIVACEFDASELPEFQKVTGKQFITVKGTLDNDRENAYLNQCKLLRIG